MGFIRRWPRWLKATAFLVACFCMTCSYRVAVSNIPPRCRLVVEGVDGVGVLLDGKPMGNTPFILDLSAQVQRRAVWGRLGILERMARTGLGGGGGMNLSSGWKPDGQYFCEGSWQMGGWEIPSLTIVFDKPVIPRTCQPEGNGWIPFRTVRVFLEAP